MIRYCMKKKNSSSCPCPLHGRFMTRQLTIYFIFISNKNIRQSTNILYCNKLGIISVLYIKLAPWIRIRIFWIIQSEKILNRIICILLRVKLAIYMYISHILKQCSCHFQFYCPSSSIVYGIFIFFPIKKKNKCIIRRLIDFQLLFFLCLFVREKTRQNKINGIPWTNSMFFYVRFSKNIMYRLCLHACL